MRYSIAIILILAFVIFSSQKTKPELKLSTDYLPTVEAFTDMKLIQTEYEKFKTKVKQNITTDYQQCVTSLETLKCNNIDQWQSVIEELQLEIKNSQEIELPFFEAKKNDKIQKLKELIEKSDSQSNQIQEILEAMEEAQKKFETNSQEIHQMYKLPADKTAFIQKQTDIPNELNSDVPNIAQKQLQQAAKEYNIGDQSIEAQTINKEMHEASVQMGKTAKSLQASLEAKSKKILNEKKKLQEDITRLRALISNENDIQAKNLKKINELKKKINDCKGKPTSIEKDCLPIQLKGEKLDTELSILNARTLLLAQHIESMMKGFESEEDISTYKEKKEAEEKLAKIKEADQKFTEEMKVDQLSPSQPKEKQPSIHFYNENEN